MKSRITIEVDFENTNQPVLQIVNFPSFDVRDKLLSSFIQSLSHTSRWLRIEYLNEIPAQDGNGHRWLIRPIVAADLAKEADLMFSFLGTSNNDALNYILAQEHLDSLNVPRRNDIAEYSFAGRIHELIQMVQSGKIKLSDQNQI